MIDLGLFFLFAIVLFLVRRFIQIRLQGLVMLMGGNKYHGVMLYSLLFLPGVIIHEMSHFFTATILGVKTGDIALFPKKITDDSNRIALGSVKIAKTDFIRASLIGAAPFFVGCIALYSIVRIFFLPNGLFINELSWDVILSLIVSFSQNSTTWIWLIVLFMVGNTMFSSKEDISAIPVLLVVLFFGGILLLQTNVYNRLSIFIPNIIHIFRSIHVTFLFVIVINLMVSGILLVIEKMLQKILKKKVIYGHS